VKQKQTIPVKYLIALSISQLFNYPPLPHDCIVWQY